MNASGVYVGLRRDGKVEIVGRGLPMRLDDEQAKDVVGGICAVKGWVVLPHTDAKGDEAVRLVPVDDPLVGPLVAAVRALVDQALAEAAR